MDYNTVKPDANAEINNHTQEMLCSPEHVCQNVNAALKQFRSETMEFISNKSIAAKIGLSEDGFSKRIKGHTAFSAYEIKNLADYLGVSCDTLLSIPNQCSHTDASMDAATRLLLDQDSLQYITDMQSSFPVGFEMLNLILENEFHICERLLRIFLYYSHATIMKITPLAGPATLMSVDSTKRMIKSLALSDLSLLLDDVSRAWNSSKRCEKNKELEKRMRKNKMHEESKRRLRAKVNMQYGKFNAIEFINIVEALSSRPSPYVSFSDYDDIDDGEVDERDD